MPTIVAIQKSSVRLSPRDKAILERLVEHRYLTSRHIEQLCFTNHRSLATASRSCRRVLARLHEQQFITRTSIRTVGGWAAGSTGYTYCLSKRSHTLLAYSPRYSVTRSPLFLEHVLAIADVRLALEQAARQYQLQLVDVQTEPSNWLQYASFGVPEILKPDLFVVTAASSRSAYEDSWFIEVDRATASGPVVLQKCRQYIAYRVSNAGRARPDGFPLVVWLVPDTRRQQELQKLLKKLPVSQQPLFKVILQQHFATHLAARYFVEYGATIRAILLLE